MLNSFGRYLVVAVFSTLLTSGLSMGQIITLADTYRYQLPDEPKQEKDILYYDLKKSDQFWQRPLIPDLKNLSATARINYIEEERRRLKEGLWMFINGVPTWITPTHYDFLMYLNHPEFESDPKYYNSHRLDCYFKDFVEKDTNCFGELVIKPRRYGYTALVISEAILKAIDDFGRNVGMASTDLDKVKETIFRPLLDSFLTRPKYVRPEIYTPNGRPPQKELRFRKNTLDELADGSLDIGAGLRSWISPRTTTSKAFDGHKWHMVIMDEIYKWTAARLYTTWYITKETLAVGGRIVGKAHLFSTMGDDETCDQSVEDGIKLWGESDYQNRNKFGRTHSGLYRWFIPGFVAYEMFMDKFGNCNESLAKEYLLEERANMEEGTKDYIYHVRKYPFTPEEAMSTAMSSSTFSAPRLAARLSKIYVLPPSEKGYITGNFAWDNLLDKVIFKPAANGYWKIAHHVPEKARNRCRRIKGSWRVPRNPEGVIGNDPVRTADNVSGHLSMNAAYVYKKFDYFGDGVSGRLIAQMYGRDEDVDVCNEQLRLAALYYGYPVLSERQITSTYDWFRDAAHGMKDFLLKGPDGGIGLWMKGSVIKDGIEAIQAMIKKPKDSEMVDFLDTIPFEELVSQLKDFEKGKSTKFDCVMALICTLEAAGCIEYTLVTDEYKASYNKLMGAVTPIRN